MLRTKNLIRPVATKRLSKEEMAERKRELRIINTYKICEANVETSNKHAWVIKSKIHEVEIKYEVISYWSSKLVLLMKTCLEDDLLIVESNNNINKRSKLIGTWKHQNKFLLKNLKKKKN